MNPSRSNLARTEVTKMKASRAGHVAAIAALTGSDKYVVYTGAKDAAVFVKLTDDMRGVLPNVGLKQATRLSRVQASRIAPLVHNGNNEVASFCTEREAHEMSIENLDLVINMLNGMLETA